MGLNFLSFLLPKGPKGDQGIQGIQGIKGDAGGIGPAGKDGALGAASRKFLTSDGELSFAVAGLTLYGTPGAPLANGKYMVSGAVVPLEAEVAVYHKAAIAPVMTGNQFQLYPGSAEYTPNRLNLIQFWPVTDGFIVYSFITLPA